MIWFTSDTHFFHNNIIKYCNLPFENIDDMNNTIRHNWNNRVSKNDIVYHLGDFAFNNNKEQYEKFIKTLNGKIILIKGSHDKNSILLKHCFHSIHSDYYLNYNGQGIFLSHHCHKVWPKSHYGTWHLFGHSHGGLNSYTEKEGKLLDVWIGNNDFYPYSIDQVIEIMKTRPDNFNLVRK